MVAVARAIETSAMASTVARAADRQHDGAVIAAESDRTCTAKRNVPVLTHCVRADAIPGAIVRTRE